ncbi:MAG: hypothetical protein IJ027_03840 [Oscillospiraceae bacterium]|nr:hypothetical protein [Oscillospiraceae bacterium]
MNKKILSLVAVVAGVVLIFFLFGGRSAEKTAKQALEAMHENDAKKFVSLMCDEAVEYQMNNRGINSKKVFVKEYEEVFDTFQAQMKEKFGKKWKYDIEIIDSYDYESTEYIYLESLEGRELKEVAYEVSYESKGLFNDEEDSESGTFLLVKEGNKWYIVNFS